MSSRRIALGVDDFGLHDGINRAALALADAGRLNALSCMVGAPAWATGAAHLLRIDRAATDIGLHLDLTQCPVRLRPLRLPALIARAYLGALPRAALRGEIEAQLGAFEAALGRPPDFVDGHQHVHQLPAVRDALFEALRARGGTMPVWLRNTRRSARDRQGGFKPWLIEALGAHALSRQAHSHGVAQNRHLLGVWNFRGDVADYRRRLEAWLQAAVDGDLLMCHPSEPVAGVDDPILAGRCVEWQVLAAPSFDALLAREGIALAPISRSVAPQRPSASRPSR